MKWAGKTFRSTEDVDPVVVYDEGGNRKWDSAWGNAKLREMKFADQNTIAMVYDDIPITDYFHYVSEDLVAGAMVSKMDNTDGIFYFVLRRLSAAAGAAVERT
ncbi:hypothetical protein XA68_10122 [Ophiocordyceps unilateralis]|uniref:Uncharacterized protein n=1 Tax=Ophiocordyceps unilateralis TaxID=268505 RepID=A0A2A9P0E3_OPHUN|nr:hypothetical protein XA68_10122 [Ophiocordyceps unilateralis]